MSKMGWVKGRRVIFLCCVFVVWRRFVNNHDSHGYAFNFFINLVAYEMLNLLLSLISSHPFCYRVKWIIPMRVMKKFRSWKAYTAPKLKFYYTLNMGDWGRQFPRIWLCIFGVNLRNQLLVSVKFWQCLYYCWFQWNFGSVYIRYITVNSVSQNSILQVIIELLRISSTGALVGCLIFFIMNLYPSILSKGWDAYFSQIRELVGIL